MSLDRLRPGGHGDFAKSLVRVEAHLSALELELPLGLHTDDLVVARIGPGHLKDADLVVRGVSRFQANVPAMSGSGILLPPVEEAPSPRRRAHIDLVRLRAGQQLDALHGAQGHLPALRQHVDLRELLHDGQMPRERGLLEVRAHLEDVLVLPISTLRP